MYMHSMSKKRNIGITTSGNELQKRTFNEILPIKRNILTVPLVEEPSTNFRIHHPDINFQTS